LSGTLNIADNGGFGVGSYTLFTYGGALATNGVSIGAKPDASLVYQLDTSIAGQVRVNVLTQFATWQLQYFSCTNCAAAADDADPDGDGLSNQAEFMAGTSPTNSASTFRITGIAVEGADVRVSWATAGGHTNLLESVGNVGDTNWLPAASAVVVTGSGDAATNAVDIGAGGSASNRYYRVRLLP
jgi:hypothetical protein